MRRATEEERNNYLFLNDRLGNPPLNWQDGKTHIEEVTLPYKEFEDGMFRLHASTFTYKPNADWEKWQGGAKHSIFCYDKKGEAGVWLVMIEHDSGEIEAYAQPKEGKPLEPSLSKILEILREMSKDGVGLEAELIKTGKAPHFFKPWSGMDYNPFSRTFDN